MVLETEAAFSPNFPGNTPPLSETLAISCEIFQFPRPSFLIVVGPAGKRLPPGTAIPGEELFENSLGRFQPADPFVRVLHPPGCDFSVPTEHELFRPTPRSNLESLLTGFTQSPVKFGPTAAPLRPATRRSTPTRTAERSSSKC